MIPRIIKLLFCVPFLIIVCYTIYLLGKYDSIPEIIPIHGYGENADGFGSKRLLFLPLPLNVLILLFIWACIRNPGKFKYSFDVKEESKARVNFNMQLTMVIIGIFVTIITTCLLFADVVYKNY